MRKPLTRTDLDAVMCAEHGDHAACEHGAGLALHASCHPESTLQVWYRDGVLLILCGACTAYVTRIAVADPPKVITQ